MAIKSYGYGKIYTFNKFWDLALVINVFFFLDNKPGGSKINASVGSIMNASWGQFCVHQGSDLTPSSLCVDFGKSYPNALNWKLTRRSIHV